MSTVAVKLLEKCIAQGISLRPGEGFKLKVSPPPEKLPAELREELKRHKAELLTFLTSQQTSSNYRASYHQAAQEIREDCFALDPVWLIEQHPNVWGELKNIDEVLSSLEMDREDGEIYRQALTRLVSTVQKARALYEGERKHFAESQQ